MEDLKKETIGVVRGYTYTKEFWDFLNRNKYEEVTDDDSNFRKMVLGRINVLVAEEANGYMIAKNMNFKVKPLGTPITTMGLYIIFNRKSVDANFMQSFTDKLKAFKKTPEYKALVQKYLK